MAIAKLSPVRVIFTNRTHGDWLPIIFATMVLLIGVLLVQLVDVTWHGTAAG